MEALAVLIGLAVTGFFVVVPIVALARAISAGRQGRRNEENWRKLTERVYALEAELKELRSGATPVRVVREVPAQAPAPTPGVTLVPSTLASAKAAESPAVAVGSETPPAETPGLAPSLVSTSPPISASLANSAVPPPPAPESVTALPSGQLAIPEAVRPTAEIAPRSFQALDEAPPLSSPKRTVSWEERFGTDWLNKLGMISLVIGVASFLALEMRTLGPAGKVLVGYAVSGAILGAGVFFERNERYRLLARVAIGGGWALTFFTTYAMYHVGPARILSSQILDLILLFSVTAVMVAHTLRYRSQVVTGMALLLAFTTVTISKENVYSLTAGAILALALVVIVQRRRWFELEVFGILASYFNHYYWLRPIIEPMHGRHRAFPEFMPSAALLIFYWLLFRLSYLLRRELSDVEEKVSTVAALLNTFLLLGLMKYQSVHPEWAFRFLLALGALEFVLGQLPLIRRRRTAFVVLTVVGATLMVAAIPFKYSGETLPILWLAEAEVLFLAGFFLNEIVFCRLGLLASLLVGIQLDRFALGQIYDTEWPGFRHGEVLRGIIEFTTASVAFYISAHGLAKRSRMLSESRIEIESLRLLSYVAGVTAVIGVWWLAPEAWVAVGFAALAWLLILLGPRLNVREFTHQAHAIALLAFLRITAVNLAEHSVYHSLLVRVLTVTLTATMLYACARSSQIARTAAVKQLSSAHTWTASLLLGLLAWYELNSVSVAIAWTLLGLVLFEIGRARGLIHLRAQAYLAFVFSFVRLFFVNFNAAGSPGEFSPRFYSTVPIALTFYYVYGVLATSSSAEFERDRRWRAAGALCFLGTFTLAGWARFEVESDWVAAAWAAMVGLLMAIAWKYRKKIFLHQGLVLGAAVLLRTALHNFYQRSYFPAPFWQSRSVTVGVTVALLFAALPFAFGQRRSRDEAQRGLWGRFLDPLERRPEQVFFFVPVFLLTVLLALELPKGMVTLAWGVEAVAIFIFALAAGQRSYRLCSLGLLLICVGKIVFLDVWGLQLRDRFLTFIVLGIALLGVSFLYTNRREAIRRYL